jgi:hypothetical protein
MADQAVELPWDGAKSPEWQRAVDSWRWASLGGGDWGKSGACPRCSHQISVTKEGGVVATIDMTEVTQLELLVKAEEGPIIAEDSSGTPLFFARCDCGEKHPRPASRPHARVRQVGLHCPPGPAMSALALVGLIVAVAVLAVVRSRLSSSSENTRVATRKASRADTTNGRLDASPLWPTARDSHAGRRSPSTSRRPAISVVFSASTTATPGIPRVRGN